MTDTRPRATATIYAFPPPTRDKRLRYRSAPAAHSGVGEALASQTVYGDAWYHDEAIREAERTRDR